MINLQNISEKELHHPSLRFNETRCEKIKNVPVFSILELLNNTTCAWYHGFSVETRLSDWVIRLGTVLKQGCSLMTSQKWGQEEMGRKAVKLSTVVEKIG